MPELKTAKDLQTEYDALTTRKILLSNGTIVAFIERIDRTETALAAANERIAQMERCLSDIHSYAVYGCGTKQKDVRGKQFGAIEEIARPYMRALTSEYQNREPDKWEKCPRCEGKGTIQCYQDGQPGLDWCPECDGMQWMPFWKQKRKRPSTAI